MQQEVEGPAEQEEDIFLRWHKLISTCGQTFVILSSVRQEIVSSRRRKMHSTSWPSQITNHKFATATHKHKR